MARSFLAEYEHQEKNSTSIKCKLAENLTRVSKDSLDTLYIILGSIILGAACVFFVEFFLSKKEAKNLSESEAESSKEKIPLYLAGLIGISKTLKNYNFWWTGSLGPQILNDKKNCKKYQFREAPVRGSCTWGKYRLGEMAIIYSE